MENFDELKRLINEIEPDVVKFYEKSNKAAAVRVRKNLQMVKEHAQALRMDIAKLRKGDAE